ncbi:hypothetical protein N7519_009954 [Penicillium mononematosum]|uniref:uncharacterized protein n=1 Tax=Penicillium mononematosum TaxID=268346 RepID=UPI00254857E7|nr:uncharacterized protein N7519_009954 [Penicillium mononematosum]KAJ6179493.1 hypothetical protein N7519_009954 [Penicillium mononematosum]
MAQSDFEPFKLEIERLYIHEDKTLPCVMEYMTSKYSLTKSSGQYSRQLKKWGFVKGHIKTDEWKWIGNKLNKRKLNENKESEFHSGEEQIQVPRLKKAKYRDAYVSTIAKFSTAPSPKTPEGFFVCTPASPGMDLIWNASLPWLRFIKLVRPTDNEEAPSPSSSLTISPLRGADAFSRTANRELMGCLSKIIPWNKLSDPPNIYSTSRTSAALSILMPEEFQGQHDALSTDLNSSKIKGTDRIPLELFLLSNNITSQDPARQTGRGISANDERVMQMVNDYGWKNLKHIQILLGTGETTAEAIAENVFASALRLHDVDAVKIMLEANMDPNIPLIKSIFFDALLTPLQFAAGSDHERSEELVNLLISYGADVNDSANDHPPLFYAINNREDEIIRALMFRGAIVTPYCLYTATRLTDIKVFTDIADSCSDVNAGGSQNCALAGAVKQCNIPMIEILLAKGAFINDLVTIDFESDKEMTTILGIGAQSGSIDVIRALLLGCDEINPDFDSLTYVSHLVLAVQKGNIKTTQALLQAGKNDSSALLNALEQSSPELVELLISAGARPNDEYSKRPYTALGAAVEHGDELLINILSAAGATFVGTKLQKIGNLRTAMYLQEIGVLQAVLRVSGPVILAAALSAEKADLAQYLLEHNADYKGLVDNEDPPLFEQTPLEAAIGAWDFILAEKLLERGANVTDVALGCALGTDPVFLRLLLCRFRGSAPNTVGIAVLHNASLQLLRQLQEAGVDPTGVPEGLQNISDSSSLNLPPPESVLEIAVFEGKREELQLLLQWMPWSPRQTGRALTLATLLNRDNIAEDILPFDPDLNQEITVQYAWGNDFRAYEGEQETYTPLQAAVNRQRIPIARALMEKVDVNYLGPGARRRTALQHAVENGNMELVNLLISEHGARIDSPPATDGGATELQIASLKGYIGIARRLLDLGADVNEDPAEYNGRTALQGAAERGRIDMLHILLDEGALIVGEGEPQYHKAVELAELNGHYAAARMLRSWRDSVYLNPSAV